MFTKIGPNAVQSSDGFKVAIIKRFELYYDDANGKTVVPIEPMADGELVVSGSTVAPDRRPMLTERISSALDFLGIHHRFD
jgi:hypothetical protein